MKNNFFQKRILQKALGRHAAKKKKKKLKEAANPYDCKSRANVMIIQIKLPFNIVNLRGDQTRTIFSSGMEGHMIIIIFSIFPKTYFKAPVVENPSRKNGLFFFF